MKIYGISVIKNEEDVIEHSLSEASLWCNNIFVLDNGSEDSTWDKVMKLSERNNKIVPWQSLRTPFYNGLRAEVYNRFRDISRKGDWWCIRLDADEFYVDNPRTFLGGIPPFYHYACKDSVEYRLTFEDVEEYAFSGKFPEDMQFIKYYRPKTWSEIRFMRYRKHLRWNPEHAFPKNIGVGYPKKIRAEHYPNRSPEQMKKRLITRLKAKQTDGFGHIIQTTWEEMLEYRENLVTKDALGNYQLLGCANKHLPKPFVQLLKRALYSIRILP